MIHRSRRRHPIRQNDGRKAGEAKAIQMTPILDSSLDGGARSIEAAAAAILVIGSVRPLFSLDLQQHQQQLSFPKSDFFEAPKFRILAGYSVCAWAYADEKGVRKANSEIRDNRES